MNDRRDYLKPLDQRTYDVPAVVFPEIGFVRLPQVLQVFPVCKSTWWAGVKEGTYPQPVKLSAGVTAWRVEDIRKLILDLSEGAV